VGTDRPLVPAPAENAEGAGERGSGAHACRVTTLAALSAARTGRAKEEQMTARKRAIVYVLLALSIVGLPWLLLEVMHD